MSGKQVGANNVDPDQTSDQGLHCLPLIPSRKPAYIILTPLNLTFIKQKLGFTGVNIIFLISAQTHTL